VRFDLANLQNVSLLVRGNQQRPLIRVRSPAFDDVISQILVGRFDVINEASVMPAIPGKRLA
jgi:hypothetical protein